MGGNCKNLAKFGGNGTSYWQPYRLACVSVPPAPRTRLCAPSSMQAPDVVGRKTGISCCTVLLSILQAESNEVRALLWLGEGLERQIADCLVNFWRFKIAQSEAYTDWRIRLLMLSSTDSANSIRLLISVNTSSNVRVEN